MFCSNCGAENSIGTSFCIQCGQSLGSVAAAGVPAVPPAPAAPPLPLSRPAAPAPNLATLLGVGGPSIEWGAGLAFLVASILADLVFLVILPLLRHQGMPPPVSWGLSFSADLILTAAAVAAFRWIRNDAGAAAIAAAGYVVPQAVVRVVILQLLLHAFQGPPAFLLYSLAANFLFLFILALAVRWLRPTWLGLWLGATAGQIAASLVYRVGNFLYSRAFEQFSFPFSFGLWDLIQDLLFAAVFAFAFWRGLALLAPKVLRE